MMLNRHDVFSRHWMYIVAIAASTIVFGVYIYFYSLSGHNQLPMGWDTPRYLGQLGTIQKNGLIAFIHENGYYNFLYLALLSLPMFLGISPFLLEIVFPIMLSAYIVVMSGVISYRYLQDKRLAVGTTILAIVWFAVYRIGSDLHANSLALAILLTACMYYPIQGDTPNRFRQAFFFILLFLASFTHIETTIFFGSIFVLTMLQLNVLRRELPRRDLLIWLSLVVFSLLPSALFYVERMRNLLTFTGGNLELYPSLSFSYWVGYLGAHFPLAIIGLITMIHKTLFKAQRRSFRLQTVYNVFFWTWAMMALILGLSQYVTLSLFIFAERAIMLFPSPFVVAPAVEEIFRLPLFKSHDLTYKRLTSVALVCATVMLLIIQPSTTYGSVAPSMKVFITPTVHEKLLWLSENYDTAQAILLLNDHDQIAGEVGNLHDNWVHALSGDHYTYLGRFDLFLEHVETPFYNPVSRAWSKIYFTALLDDDVFNSHSLQNYTVFLITDFFLPRPLPTYISEYFDEIYPGLFVLNQAQIGNLQSVYISLYVGPDRLEGDWVVTESTWADSLYTLTLRDGDQLKPAFCEVPISISHLGQYHFTLSYQTTLDLTIELDGNLIGEIQGIPGNAPATYTTRAIDLLPGFHALKIIVEQSGSEQDFVSLDFVNYSSS